MATIRMSDGVATAVVGNCLVVVWRDAARVARWQWVRAQVDLLANRVAGGAAAFPEGVVMLQVIQPTSDPPDQATRTAAQADMKAWGKRVRAVVTLIEGDDPLRAYVVRPIVRGLAMLGGQAHLMKYPPNLPAAVTAVRDAAGATPPSAADLQAAVTALQAALASAPRAA